MKRSVKKMLSFLLALCLALQCVPAMGVAASADESHVQQIVYAPAEELPGNDELFAMYVEQQLYGSGWTTFGTAARENLNTAEQGIYDDLKARIETVAANGGSTEFVLSDISGLKTEWTREELGVESIEDLTEAKAQFAAQFSLSKIISALLSDCPFDLYWYDKTVGSSMTYSVGRSGMSDGTNTYWTKATFRDITITFKVAAGYQDGGNLAVTSDVARVSTAKAKAQEIVAAYESGTDYEKLVAYKNTICDLVSYNDEAADDSYTGGYGDPWQLIYVFDGDAATEVVCEGYAKAFQYLCDLSGLDCIIVTGVMSGGTGSGGHMWNIVTLDGENYLVDVTNCDEGTIGAPDKLFLVGNATGSVSGGYSYSFGSQTIRFTYDADILETWTESQLTLAASNYEPGCSHTGGTATCTEKAICALCGEAYGDYATHAYETAVTAPTCTEGGYTTYTCSVCGEGYVDDKTDPQGHTEETIPGKAATCTETGLTEGVKCIVCGEVLTEQEEIAALEHAYEAAVTAPTCTEGGYTTYTCSVCGEGYVDDKTDPQGHTEETIPGKAATCTETGLTEGVKCIVCGEILTKQEEIPTLDHSYEKGICTVCGEVGGAAYHEGTGAVYQSVSEALSAAAAGEKVLMLRNSEEGTVMVPIGVTLDLNGFVLTAEFLVAFDSAHVIDGVGTGRLISAEQNVVLDEANAMVPVYDGEGYIFTKAGFAISLDDSYAGEGVKINAVACPVRMDVVQLLKDGSEDNNLQIVILLSWETEEGTGSQKFAFTDEVVKDVYSSNKGDWDSYGKMFSMVITGFGSIQNLRANMVIASGTDAEYVSSNSVEIG